MTEMQDDQKLATQTLLSVSRDGADAEELMPLVYERLRDVATRWFQRQPKGATLQPTALVHEAYLHLIDQTSANWSDRAHFFAVAATAMRQILIQRARHRGTAKRGGNWNRVELEGAAVAGGDVGADLLALDDEIRALAKLNQRQARIVELRFFGGLTEEEIGAALGIAPRTVRLDWRMAKAWLRDRMTSERSVSPGDPDRSPPMSE